MEEEEEEASAELISPRISFSHDLAAFAACPTTTQPEPRRSDASLMSRRRRRRVAEPEFDFANAAAADVAPADRLFADGKLLPVPPLPPTAPHARCAKATRPAPRSWASPFARSSSVNSARAASAASGRFTCPAFPLMRSRSTGSAAATATVGAHQRQHCKKVAPTTASGGVHNGNSGAGARSVYYYGYGGGRNGSDGHGGGGVRMSPVLNVTSIGTSVVNMLSHLLCDCGEKAGKQQSRALGVRCWVTR
ncbi:hypothetical protein CFC21_039341 [Triticum aestivum]|uniref:Uncharacterized protein n=3 Tax=Triticum TaxID=4564 RepID=A0A9R1FEG2_WHEAT|nr:uncharacterized protein LOC119280615 [Triticum dicoccoides]XP_044343927.1 uncharacterized protein LOC123064526 [Triticum aestivum]KAF7027288.1 hypothetical protein CFC21_039341 [Triticum aestivum]CDM80782.1 unnamed protein product [Triticum aestivum]VAH71634.1 unnamed protein product [Triticum turgidum subsp. durum]